MRWFKPLEMGIIYYKHTFNQWTFTYVNTDKRSFIHSIIDLCYYYQYQGNNSSRFPRNSKAFATEFLEFEEMLILYNM